MVWIMTRRVSWVICLIWMMIKTDSVRKKRMTDCFTKRCGVIHIYLICRTVLFLWEKVSYKLHTESAKPLAKNKVCLQALFFCHKAEASWGLGMPNPQQVPARVYTGRNLLYLMRRIRSLCRLRSARISGNRISFRNDAPSCSRISYGECVWWIFCKTGV